MQPIIYNSLDASAPQLTIAAGTLKTILKACLVTGYGDKAAAGWEIAWADDVANKIAFRSKNPTSTKSVLLVDDNAAASATVTAYNGWDSATNTGTGQFATGYFVKQWAINITKPNWVVVATDKFFYLFIQEDLDSITMRVMSGFGDAISLRNDRFFSVCLCQVGTSDTQDNTGYSEISTQLNLTAKFPKSLYPKFSGSENFWGDQTHKSNLYQSKTAILSQFALYMLIDGLNQPVLQLPGMLMPYSEILGYTTKNNIDSLSNQLPYKNPIYGILQPWHGRVWIHTDDWGQ